MSLLESPHTRSRRKDARPGELLEAALSLFVERGFAATRLDDVAQRAGVSKGLTYRYFPSKEALFKAVIRESVVARIEGAEQHLASFEGTTEALLRDIVDAFWEFDRSPSGGVLKLVIAEAHNFPDVARYYVDEAVFRGRKLFADIIRRGIERGEFRALDPEKTAPLLASPLSMLSVWRHSLQPYDNGMSAGEYLKTYLDLMLAGLRAGGAEAGKS